ncbi:hypothetical protein Scep_011537 [Stephania cephalantha]|uniref:Uncharacterized protein n=1 Tax=Stephania cephalantha TaxID=152367 RepID=A0AAP0P6K6_9MAGN
MLFHFAIYDSCSAHVLDLVHADVWGPSSVSSTAGFNYYITSIDHSSIFTWIYHLKNKSDALQMFKLFKVRVENQFSTKSKKV